MIYKYMVKLKAPPLVKIHSVGCSVLNQKKKGWGGPYDLDERDFKDWEEREIKYSFCPCTK